MVTSPLAVRKAEDPKEIPNRKFGKDLLKRVLMKQRKDAKWSQRMKAKKAWKKKNWIIEDERIRIITARLRDGR